MGDGLPKACSQQTNCIKRNWGTKALSTPHPRKKKKEEIKEGLSQEICSATRKDREKKKKKKKEKKEEKKAAENKIKKLKGRKIK